MFTEIQPYPILHCPIKLDPTKPPMRYSITYTFPSNQSPTLDFHMQIFFLNHLSKHRIATVGLRLTELICTPGLGVKVCTLCLGVSAYIEDQLPVPDETKHYFSGQYFKSHRSLPDLKQGMSEKYTKICTIPYVNLTVLLCTDGLELQKGKSF